MFSSTPKKPTFSPPAQLNTMAGTTLLPPLSALFTEKPNMYASKLPTINDILAQTPRQQMRSYSSSLELTSYSLDISLKRPTALRPSSFPVGSTAPSSTYSDNILQGANATKALLQPVSSTSTPSESPFTESAAKIASKIKSNNSPTRDFAFISHSPATFPSQEPAIDNASLARRKRRRTSPNELAILNQEFVLGSTPGKSRRLEISKKVNMTEKAVQIWFQNKRQSIRRLRACDKEVTELPPTPDTTINSSYASDTSVDMSDASFTQPLLITPTSPAKDIQAQLSPYRLAINQKFENYDKKPSFRLPVGSTCPPDFKHPGATKDRKPLAVLDPNVKNRAASDAQCIQGLLSLRTAAH